MRYSVVIPIYNAEKTVGRCVDSLLAQLREDVELLLVNDGSVDGTDRICRAYEAKAKNIKYFYKKNQGVSSARNVGLKHAAGQFILFVDSDDFVAPDLFERLDDLLADDPDLLILSTCLVNGNCQNYEYADKRYVNVNDMESRREFSSILAGYMGKSIMLCSSAKVFKRKLIQKYSIEFCEHLRIAEDAVFLFAYLLHIESFRSDDYIAYYACTENAESLSRGRRPYLPEQLLRGCRERLAILEKSELADEECRIMRGIAVWYYYRSVYSCAMELLKYEFSSRERRKRLRVICEKYRVESPDPMGLKCWLVAFPVRWRLVGLIDLAARMRARMRGTV